MSANQPLTGHDRPGDPCTIVIFGASGDLTKRKLLPALYNLKVLKLLPDNFAVIGVAVSESDDALYRQKITEDIHEFATGSVEKAEWDDFVRRSYYLSGDFNDPTTFQRLADKIAGVQKTHQLPGNVLFYLAISPTFFAKVVDQLGAVGLTLETESAWRRVIIEKPFGHDLASARELNNDIGKTLRERQIYRIDHYLGKETVQNIMVFRFGNSVFEPIWNRRYIEYVQITVAEELGVELRGGYYDQSGVLRDMVQNHILSVLSLIAMEPPTSITGDSVRNEKVKVLEAIRPMEPEEVIENTVRGQYAAGLIAGQGVPAYRTEPDVNPRSNTETFVAMKLKVENWRWAEVPFYIRSGKRLATRTTEVVIGFRRAPLLLFGKEVENEIPPNRLVLHVQPEEGITLDIHAKRPGPKIAISNIPLNFNYKEFGETSAATGYETLLYDCMIGETTLFHRYDSVDASWRIVNPILDIWKALPARDFPNYAAGTWGPRASDDLVSRDGHRWHHYPLAVPPPPEPPPPVATAQKLLLAGDIGGTKANLAIFAMDQATGHLRLRRNKRYPSADFPSLNAIAQRFLGKGDEERIHAACFGVPGPVRNNRAQPTNLKWDVDAGSLRADLAIPSVHLLNDLAANAYGITELADTDFHPIQGGLNNPVGNRCVVSPGTGLGEAGLFWDGHRHRVWACEGGHADFAPRSEVEVELLGYLQTRFGHVSNERIISGQGLTNIYAFLRDTGKHPQHGGVTEEMKTTDLAKVITRHAEAGTCPMCMQTVEIFVHCLAMEAGNFALRAMATGGVYLGGGVPAKLIWKLAAPAFRQAFNAKGRLEPLMESMPVKVILNDQAALLGAARYAFDALED